MQDETIVSAGGEKTFRSSIRFLPQDLIEHLFENISHSNEVQKVWV